jgi:hypothetical protein
MVNGKLFYSPQALRMKSETICNFQGSSEKLLQHENGTDARQ